MNIRDAVHSWVERDMTAVPVSVAEKLLKYSNYTDWEEITPLSVNDRVWYVSEQEIGSIVKREDDIFTVELDNGELIECDETEISVERDTYFPMWSTMWSFDDGLDQEWAEGNLQKIADCGFRIYESEDYGYVIGIDGAGYSFYNHRWIPLYRARGLRWHDEE